MDIGSIGHFFTRLFRHPRVRPEALLIAIGGALIAVTVVLDGDLHLLDLLALGLAR